jgi:transcriptional regulator with XRE-family HTH domain
MNKKRSKAKTKPMDQKNQTDFSRFIINYRMVHNLSQRELANKLEMSYTPVALLELGKDKMPVAFFRRLYPHLSNDERAAVRMMFQAAILREIEGEL